MSVAHAQMCEDLFRPAAVARSSGLRGIGRSLYERVVPSAAKSRAEFAFEQSFVQSEREALHDLLVPGSRESVRRLESGGRSWESRDLLFLYQYFEKMSGPQRSVLERTMNSGLLDSKDRVGSAYRLIEHIGEAPVNSQSFVSVVVESWFVGTREKPQSFSEWTAGLREFYLSRKAEGAFESPEFRNRLKDAIDSTLAHQLWRRTVSLEALGAKIDGKKNLVLGNRTLGKIEREDANDIVIRVSRDQVKRAAWNPISSREILRKIENGFRTVDIYEAFLGADGHFYLLDGNHRFALDSRHEVLLKFSRPLSAASISDTLDAIGIPQPKLEALVRYEQGQLSLAELLGEGAAKNLILIP